MAEKTMCVSQQQTKPIKITKWKVSEGNTVSVGRVILLYDFEGAAKPEQRKFKANQAGTVATIMAQEGAIVAPGEILCKLLECTHPTIMNDMCAECGTDLRKNEVSSSASVPMVHAIPDLKVSEEVAQKLGRADTDRLIKDRKLVLLVDLDQTLIHTTNDNIPSNLKDVYHFQLYGPSSPWYHTRLRPGTHRFLSNVFPMFELHICTFGARNYAHMIAAFLDPEQKFFSNRILSRDECFDPTSKKANLKALFPCGDNMVCIIDDREDVWSNATNLIHVKPYHFFQHTGDINAPPGLDKHENDNKGVDLTKIKEKHVDGETTSNETQEDENVETTNKNPDPVEPIVEETEKSMEVEENVEPVIEESAAESKKVNNEDKKEEAEEVNKADDEDSKKEIPKEEKREEVENNEDEPASSVVRAVNGNSEETEPEAKNMEVDGTSETKHHNDTSKGEESLIEIEDPDDYLLHLEDILRRIHVAFYEDYDKLESGEVPDLKKVIPQVRSRVLKDCKLVFSGLVPTHIKLEQSKAYQIARSLGATVSQDLDDDTTHLVAIRPGTAKVNAGRRKKKLKIVTPDWLWSCAERWEHVNEKIFPLNSKGSKNRHPPPHCSSPEHITMYPEHNTPALRKRTPSGRFMDTINPLMSFSSDDIADMDKEVEDILDDESDTTEDEEDDESAEPKKEKKKKKSTSKGLDDCEDSSSSADSLSAEFPKGFKRKRVDADNFDDFEDDELLDGREGEEDDDELPGVKFRRGELADSELDMEQSSQESDGSAEAQDEDDDGDDGEWNMMGAALEREFLSNN